MIKLNRNQLLKSLKSLKSTRHVSTSSVRMAEQAPMIKLTIDGKEVSSHDSLFCCVLRTQLLRV